MQKLIEILKDKQIFIISPHFDDAVLSCWSILTNATLAPNITVINVFTAGSNLPYTLSAKKFLQASHSSNAKSLYRDRTNEDKSVMEKLNIKYINLGFVDALFRKKFEDDTLLQRLLPELSHMYPTYKFHVLGKIAKHDDSVNDVHKKLAELIPEGAFVLTPINVSKHVDHAIVKEACTKLKNKLVSYSEFPYNLKHTLPKSYINIDRFDVYPDLQKKEEVLKLYTSQFDGLFTNGIVPRHKEVFYAENPTTPRITQYDVLTKELADEWQKLWETSSHANPVNSPAWFMAADETFDTKGKKIITIRVDDQLVAILGLFKRNGSYTTLPEDVVCGTPYLIANEDTFNIELLIKELETLECVVLNNVPANTLNYVNPDDHNYQAIYNGPNYSMEIETTSPKFMKKKQEFLHKIKGKEDKFNLETYIGYDKQIFDKIYELDDQTRKHERGYNAFASATMRTFYKNLAQRLDNDFRLHVLTYENSAIAYEIGFLSQNKNQNSKYLGSQLAFHADYKSFAPGKVLILNLLENLAKNGIKIMDFGSGNNHLKRSLTNTRTHLYTVVIGNNQLLINALSFIYASKYKIFTFMDSHKNIYTAYKNLRKII